MWNRGILGGLAGLLAAVAACAGEPEGAPGGPDGDHPDDAEWLSVKNPVVEDTPTYTTLVGLGTFNPSYRGYSRIEPCNPQLSSVLLRMATRSSEQMPPMATEIVHEAGLDVVSSFLRTLQAPGVPPCPIVEQRP